MSSLSTCKRTLKLLRVVCWHNSEALRSFSHALVKHKKVFGMCQGSIPEYFNNNSFLFPFIGHMRVAERRFYIDTQETPNPNSMKFSLGKDILNSDTQPQDFSSPKKANDCNLVSQLHQVAGVKGVYIGRDFLTISKAEDVEWLEMALEIKSIIAEYFSMNEFVTISQDPMKDEIQDETHCTSKEREVIAMIRELIETKIRPTVQEDGGDIVYMGFEGGVVKVKLQGSCTSCPSSQVTLKKGVQNMLQFYVPEVMGVLQVEDERNDFSDQEFEKFNSSLEKKS